MRLQLATWPEVDEYLKTSKGIIMPIGSTEQHGPTGLVGTDALTAEAIGQRLEFLAFATSCDYKLMPLRGFSLQDWSKCVWTGCAIHMVQFSSQMNHARPWAGLEL